MILPLVAPLTADLDIEDGNTAKCPFLAADLQVPILPPPSEFIEAESEDQR